MWQAGQYYSYKGLAILLDAATDVDGDEVIRTDDWVATLYSDNGREMYRSSHHPEPLLALIEVGVHIDTEDPDPMLDKWPPFEEGDRVAHNDDGRTGTATCVERWGYFCDIKLDRRCGGEEISAIMQEWHPFNEFDVVRDMLHHHDWTFMMSDDPRWFHSGRKQVEEICEKLDELPPPEVAELAHEFSHEATKSFLIATRFNAAIEEVRETHELMEQGEGA